MTIVYSLVSVGKNVLAEYTTTSGTFFLPAAVVHESRTTFAEQLLHINGNRGRVTAFRVALLSRESRLAPSY